MHPNIGTTDRWIRIIIGLGILALGMTFKSWWGLVGFIPILTAAIKWCPPYALLGLSTCPAQRNPA